MATADEIPVAHTPAGGYGPSFPPLVLAGCTEPLVDGAPDLRGVWRTVSATRGGEPVPADDRLMSYTERIEQCGNRIVDCGGGTIADARADGTEEQVAAPDLPEGVWGVTVVESTGQTWTIPNNLAGSVSLSSDFDPASQATAVVVGHGG
jgi:hypothetical protein